MTSIKLTIIKKISRCSLICSSLSYNTVNNSKITNLSLQLRSMGPLVGVVNNKSKSSMKAFTVYKTNNNVLPFNMVVVPSSNNNITNLSEGLLAIIHRPKYPPTGPNIINQSRDVWNQLNLRGHRRALNDYPSFTKGIWINMNPTIKVSHLYDQWANKWVPTESLSRQTHLLRIPSWKS